MRVPGRLLVDLIYDLIRDQWPDGHKHELDELLELPFNVHPDATPQKKRERAAFFAGLG